MTIFMRFTKEKTDTVVKPKHTKPLKEMKSPYFYSNYYLP